MAATRARRPHRRGAARRRAGRRGACASARAARRARGRRAWGACAAPRRPRRGTSRPRCPASRARSGCCGGRPTPGLRRRPSAWLRAHGFLNQAMPIQALPAAAAGKPALNLPSLLPLLGLPLPNATATLPHAAPRLAAPRLDRDASAAAQRRATQHANSPRPCTDVSRTPAQRSKHAPAPPLSAVSALAGDGRTVDHTRA